MFVLNNLSFVDFDYAASLLFSLHLDELLLLLSLLLGLLLGLLVSSCHVGLDVSLGMVLQTKRFTAGSAGEGPFP